MITNRLILIACLTLGFISSYNLLVLSYAKYFICRKCNFVISDGLDLNLGYPSGLAGRARRWPKFGFLLALMIENIFTDPVNLISIWLLSHSKRECNFSDGTPWSVPDLKGPLEVLAWPTVKKYWLSTSAGQEAKFGLRASFDRVTTNS